MNQQHTYSEVKHWYKKSIQKAGDVLICHELGHDHEKLPDYINMLQRLIEALNLKRNGVTDIDKISDINIMIEHINVLLSHMNRDLGRNFSSPTSMRTLAPSSPKSAMSVPLKTFQTSPRRTLQPTGTRTAMNIPVPSATSRGFGSQF